MKLTKRTRSILQNFASFPEINAVYWEPGKPVVIGSATSSEMAMAELEEQFDKPFLLNIEQFLRLADIFDDPEISFHDTYMQLKEGPNTFKCVLHPLNLRPNLTFPVFKSEGQVTMTLPWTQIQHLRKAASSLADGSTEAVIYFEWNGTEMKVRAQGSVYRQSSFEYNVPSSDFSIQEDVKPFSTYVKDRMLHLLKSDSYKVRVRPRELTHWVGQDVSYAIPFAATKTGL
jgi:hypothetical protein